jgi:hypothetical protein
MAGLTKEQKAAKALLEKAIELSGLKADEFNQLSADERAAFNTKAQEALDAAANKPDEEEVDNSHLIAVTKGGETIDVHPTCLADHKRMGWKEA